ncbi:hypothetical protein HII31_08522, partial [Pseudocercospora fuligena]
MDLAMAPPVKRRKLSSTLNLEIHRDNCTETSDTSSHHTFTTLPRPIAAPTLQTSLPRVEEERSREVHPAVGGIEDFKVLLPRQGTVAVAADLSVSVSVAPTIAYQDASTTITYTPPATPSLPTLPSISGATTFSTTSTSLSSTSTSAATTSTKAIDTNSTRSSSRTSSSVSADTFFIATLSDGDTTIITRARTAYVTTFADGEAFTIPGLSSTLSRSGTSSTTTTSDSEQSTVTATALINGSNAASPGAYGTPATSAPSSSTSSGSASNNNHSNSNSPPPAGTIAGGVVGGCAGLAVIVLIAMLFVRWYRRRTTRGHQALPPASSDSPEQPGHLSRGPGMAERAGLMPLAAAVPAMFRYHNRSAEPSESSERGFTRVSGRKLPSAWSEGMSSPPPEMPLNAATTSTAGASASYYRDSPGQYGGDGTGFPPSSPTASPTSPASSHGPLRSSTHEMISFSPGAQRQPQLHAGGPYGFTGGPSGFQRSDTPSSLDPSRNSRFTEEM